MKKIYLYAVAIPIVLFSNTALKAQVADSLSDQELESVEITATRFSSKLDILPVNIELVNQSKIEETQPLTPVEALQYIPGLVRQSDGGLASTPIIRGLARERAPILIDGNPFVGGRIRSYTLIDPSQIERIEVIKGPASAFWGSDAVSGLVNIVTRKAENGYGKKMKVGGSLYGGYHSVAGFYRGRVEIEGRGNGLDFLIGGGLRNAGNTNTPKGPIENSQFESNNFDFNIGYSWAKNHRVEVNGKYFKNENTGFPGGLGAPGPPTVNRRFNPDEQFAFNIAYDGKNISDRIASIGVRGFYKKQQLHIDQVTNDTLANGNARTRDLALDVDVPFMGAKFFITLIHNDKSKLTLGGDYLREHRIGTHRALDVQIFNPDGVMVVDNSLPFEQVQPDSYSNSFGVFAIEKIQLHKKLNLLLAGRLDNVSTNIEDGPFSIAPIASIYNDGNTSDSDWAVSGNIGLKYSPSNTFSFVANVANSFRGTDLFSKYHFTAVGAGFLVPNPDLDPERGVFYELGVSVNQKVFFLKASFYQNFLNNLFVLNNLQFNDAASVQFQNVGKASITGIEWDVQVNFGASSHVFISGSFITGTNRVTNDPLQEIPATQTWAGIHYRDSKNRFFVQPEAFLVFSQNNVAPNEITTPGYAVFNIRAGLNFHEIIEGMPHSKLTLSLTNIGEKAYRSHVSRGNPGNQNTFLEAGRSLNIGLVMRFGEHVK